MLKILLKTSSEIKFWSGRRQWFGRRRQRGRAAHHWFACIRKRIKERGFTADINTHHLRFRSFDIVVQSVGTKGTIMKWSKRVGGRRTRIGWIRFWIEGFSRHETSNREARFVSRWALRDFLLVGIVSNKEGGSHQERDNQKDTDTRSNTECCGGRSRAGSTSCIDSAWRSSGAGTRGGSWRINPRIGCRRCSSCSWRLSSCWIL